jgi:hypothetical protein
MLYHIADSPTLMYKTQALCGTAATSHTYLVRASHLKSMEERESDGGSTLCPACESNPKLPMLILACVASIPESYVKTSTGSRMDLHTKDEIDFYDTLTGSIHSAINAFNYKDKE